MIRLGEFELHAVTDGFFRLDGGAMFGIVPKVAWEKVAPADEKNRITLSLTNLLIRAHGNNILVDTGIGTKHDPKFVEMYAVVHPPTTPESLAKIDVKPEDVNFVVLSHLHFDHAGGATVLRNGEIVPTYPNATYIIQEGMWREAQESNPRTKGSYIPDDFLPLQKAGRVKLIKGDYEIVPGVRCVLTGGHVKHHQVVRMESRGEKAIYWADLLPTSAHIKPAWVMGYDLYPHEVASLKQQLVAEAMRERWVNVFEHDPNVAMARISDDRKGGFSLEPLEKVPR
ncbi:MAG TPA: MBL fold metallo-hydrolase [Planctomycetota bacterium]|nr:MBL fold metallo-hydrolase [Planctomycetota bacterium]